MYISKVFLKNIKCFKEFELDFEKAGDSVLIAADNGDGKTTLLQSIAMGLCDESSSAALFRELKGELLAHGVKSGEIHVHLKDKTGDSFAIETKISLYAGFEWLSQKCYTYKGNKKQLIGDPDDFPWKKIFACGYGAGRQTRGTGDFDKYAPVDAVYTLFRYYEPHQNSELAFRRLVDLARKKGGRDPSKKEEKAKEMYNQLCRALHKMLNLEPKDKIELKSNTIVVKGHWGECNLDSLSDGYKGTITWALDFLWWHTLYRRLRLSDLKKMSGIVLIDEIEQHLHPRWQQNILPALCEIFPQIQFIATTHSPLVVSGCENIRVHSISQREHKISSVYGWLAEDVYREVMDLSTSTRAPKFEKQILTEFQKLDRKRIVGKASRADLAKRNKLRKKLSRLPESDPVGLTLEIENITDSLKKLDKKK